MRNLLNEYANASVKQLGNNIKNSSLHNHRVFAHKKLQSVIEYQFLLYAPPRALIKYKQFPNTAPFESIYRNEKP